MLEKGASVIYIWWSLMLKLQYIIFWLILQFGHLFSHGNINALIDLLDFSLPGGQQLVVKFLWRQWFFQQLYIFGNYLISWPLPICAAMITLMEGMLILLNNLRITAVKTMDCSCWHIYFVQVSDVFIFGCFWLENCFGIFQELPLSASFGILGIWL